GCRFRRCCCIQGCEARRGARLHRGKRYFVRGGLGEELPFINPVLKTLNAIREKVETVRRNREGLTALHKRCTSITERVIDKCRQNPSSEMDVTPLEECVEDVRNLVERCSIWRNKVLVALKASSDKDEIAELNARVDRLTGDLGLTGITTLVTCSARAEFMGKGQVAQLGEILANQEIIKDSLRKTPAKQADIPKGTPIRKSWHVQRHNVIQTVFRALTGGQEPAMVGLVGDSGSGKTTAASEIVRSIEVREAFSDGILWLTLARMVHSDLEGGVGHPPVASDDGAAYIKRRMMETSYHDGIKGAKKCLVVADNVWDKEAVSKLLETGMWVLVSTRDGQLVKGARGDVVGVDELSEADAESVLRRASELPPEARLPVGAVDLIELCGRVAMDLAFVGRWSTVRRRQDRAAWSDAASRV
ncbi:unnamed protein product, partial [Laminaria digitata]